MTSYDAWKSREPDTVTIWDEIRASNASDNLPNEHEAEWIVENALHLSDFIGDLTEGMSNGDILNLAVKSVSQMVDGSGTNNADARLAIDLLACQGRRILDAREQAKRDAVLDAWEAGYDLAEDYDGDLD